jgi:hypothetical protein
MRISFAIGSLAVTTAVPSWPRFSWDTVPVFYHSCNFTGDYTAEGIAIMAKVRAPLRHPTPRRG